MKISPHMIAAMAGSLAMIPGRVSHAKARTEPRRDPDRHAWSGDGVAPASETRQQRRENARKAAKQAPQK